MLHCQYLVKENFLPPNRGSCSNFEVVRILFLDSSLFVFGVQCLPYGALAVFYFGKAISLPEEVGILRSGNYFQQGKDGACVHHWFLENKQICLYVVQQFFVWYVLLQKKYFELAKSNVIFLMACIPVQQKVGRRKVNRKGLEQFSPIVPTNLCYQCPRNAFFLLFFLSTNWVNLKNFQTNLRRETKVGRWY